MTAAVAVALAVGGGPGGAQPRGDRPQRPLPQRVAAARPGGARRPPPAPAGRSRDVGGGAEEAVPQSQPGREARGGRGVGCGDPGPRSPAAWGLWRPEGPLLGRGGGSEGRPLPPPPPPAGPRRPGPALCPERCHSEGFRGPGAEVAGRGGWRAGQGRAEACALRSAPPPYPPGRGTPGPPGAYLEVGSPRGRVLQPRAGSGDAGSRGRLGVDPAGARRDPGPGLPMAVPRLRAVLAAPAGLLLPEGRGLARRRRQTRKQTVRRTSTRRARQTARWGRLGKLPGGGDASLGN